MTQMKTDLLAFAKAVSDFKPLVCMLVLIWPVRTPVTDLRTTARDSDWHLVTCTVTGKQLAHWQISTHTQRAKSSVSFPYRRGPHHLNLKKQWKHNEVKAAHTERRVKHKHYNKLHPVSCFWKLELERKCKQTWTNKRIAAYLSNNVTQQFSINIICFDSYLYNAMTFTVWGHCRMLTEIPKSTMKCEF